MNKFGVFVRSKAFEVIFMIVGLLSLLYLVNRMSLLIISMTGYDIKILLLVMLLLYSAYMVGYIKSKKEIMKTRKLYEFCSLILCFILHLLLLLLVHDIINLFIKLDNKYYLIPVILAVIVTIYGFINARKIKVKTYDIDISHKDKIVLLSDLHVGSFVELKQLSNIINKVNELAADKVIIAGDLFDVEAYRHVDSKPLIALLKQIKVKDKVYAVLGNHDVCSRDDYMRNLYQKANVTLLIDEYYEDEDIVIVGRDDIITNPMRKRLDEIIKTPKKMMVIDHNPLGADEAIANNASLIMCGHTHRGQFFPANVFTKLAYGKAGFYGYHKLNNTNIVVSSGVGYFQMPMRTCSHSEIVVLACH